MLKRLKTKIRASERHGNMEDIAPGLYEAVKRDFDRYYKGDQRARAVRKKVDKGTATWKDAYDFGIYIADDLQKAFKKNITEDALPNGRMYYNIAERVVRPMLEEMEDTVRGLCKEIVEAQNKRNGIGLKAV